MLHCDSVVLLCMRRYLILDPPHRVSIIHIVGLTDCQLFGILTRNASYCEVQRDPLESVPALCTHRPSLLPMGVVVSIVESPRAEPIYL